MAFLQWGDLRVLLAVLTKMTRFLLRSRKLFAVGLFFMLALVVSLSAATRQPCLRACSAPWRVWKAGHMTEPDTRAAGAPRVTVQAESPQVALEPAPARPVYSLRQERSLPPTISLVLPIRHLRAPPRFA